MSGLAIPAAGLPLDASRPSVRLHAVIPTARGWSVLIMRDGRVVNSRAVPALALLADGVKSWLEPMACPDMVRHDD